MTIFFAAPQKREETQSSPILCDQKTGTSQPGRVAQLQPRYTLPGFPVKWGVGACAKLEGRCLQRPQLPFGASKLPRL